MDGILLIDKLSGWTSFDVVAKVRGTLRAAKSPELRVQSQVLPAHSSQLITSSLKVKVGHTGTLDPLATGLLVLVLGDYCKRAGEFSKLDKTYDVTMILGQTSTTGDAEGVKKTVGSSKSVSKEDVEAILRQFTGEIMQTPPIYSAIKINGQRAYKLARAGHTVKLEPRQVHIYSNILKNIRMPEVFFEVEVSSGTYVRSLVEDMGKALGTGAYMADLRRTKVGNWNIKDAVDLPEISAETITQHLITL